MEMEKEEPLRCTPRFRMLNEDGIETIHRGSLEILETVGVKVLHPEAATLLKNAGCRVKSDDVIEIPGELVEQSIQSAPSEIIVYNRNGEEAMRLSGNRTWFGPGTDLLRTHDLKSGELRPSSLQDVKNAAIIADYFDEIDFIASCGLPAETHPNMAEIASFRTLVRNSTKPIYFTAVSREDLAVIHEMASAVAGGDAALFAKPFIIHYAEPVSPLMHSRGAVEKLLYCADHGIPLNYVPSSMSGATSPVTLAGAIAIANAEALSGLVIQQLRRKGAPMISGFNATPLDMAHGTTVYASPEERLTHSACADLYHHYGIPVWGTAGCSDAKLPDEQAAMESAISILMAALDGVNLIHDVGYLGQGLIGSPAAIVMGAEIISYVKRILRGFEVSREHLGLDVIRRVGPGGHFLSTKHTRRHFRKEHWRPMLLDRKNPGKWKEEGSLRYGDRAVAKALEILASHRPEPLPDDLLEKLDRIASIAETELAGKKPGV